MKNEFIISGTQLEDAPEAKIQIRINYERNTVSVGNHVFSEPCFLYQKDRYRIYSDTVMLIIIENIEFIDKKDIDIYHTLVNENKLSYKENESDLFYRIDVARENAFLSKYLGSQFYKRIRKAMFLLWLAKAILKMLVQLVYLIGLLGRMLVYNN